MPLVTEEKTQGWVSCRDPRCGGHTERETEVTRRTQAFSYRELGGDLPGNEREAVDVVHNDAPCPVCGGPQVYADQPRPEYANISGQDQLALLNLNQSGQIRDQQMAGLEQAKELAELKAREAERDKRDAERDRMFMEMQAELQRRRGGRPPKDTDAA
jgi:hypothetical protein